MQDPHTLGLLPMIHILICMVIDFPKSLSYINVRCVEEAVW